MTKPKSKVIWKYCESPAKRLTVKHAFERGFKDKPLCGRLPIWIDTKWMMLTVPLSVRKPCKDCVRLIKDLGIK